MTKFFKEEVPVMVGDLREAAIRMAHICKAGRPEWVECPGNCPGRMACGKEQLAPAEIPEAAAEEVPGEEEAVLPRFQVPHTVEKIGKLAFSRLTQGWPRDGY